jgi:hypothetical protein
MEKKKDTTAAGVRFPTTTIASRQALAAPYCCRPSCHQQFRGVISGTDNDGNVTL